MASPKDRDKTHVDFDHADVNRDRAKKVGIEEAGHNTDPKFRTSKTTSGGAPVQQEAPQPLPSPDKGDGPHDQGESK